VGDPSPEQERTNMSGVSFPYRYAYETVAVSQTDQPLGTTGATGDYLHRLLIAVATAATSAVTVKDGSTTVLATPANTPIGVYSIEINAVSRNGAWTVTTAAGVTVVGVGVFSA
jgi:hypothetical protein